MKIDRAHPSPLFVSTYRQMNACSAMHAGRCTQGTHAHILLLLLLLVVRLGRPAPHAEIRLALSVWRYHEGTHGHTWTSFHAQTY